MLIMPPIVAVGPGLSFMFTTNGGEVESCCEVRVMFRTYGSEQKDPFLFQGLVDPKDNPHPTPTGKQGPKTRSE